MVHLTESQHGKFKFLNYKTMFRRIYRASLLPMSHQAQPTLPIEEQVQKTISVTKKASIEITLARKKEASSITFKKS